MNDGFGFGNLQTVYTELNTFKSTCEGEMVMYIKSTPTAVLFENKFVGSHT